MDRRNFLKRVAATTAVGAVAPKVLAEPTTPIVFAEDMECAALTASAIGIDSAAAAAMTAAVCFTILKPRALTGKYNELTFAHRELFLDSEPTSGA